MAEFLVGLAAGVVVVVSGHVLFGWRVPRFRRVQASRRRVAAALGFYTVPSMVEEAGDLALNPPHIEALMAEALIADSGPTQSDSAPGPVSPERNTPPTMAAHNEARMRLAERLAERSAEEGG